MKRAIKVMAPMAAVALLLAACGQAPSDDGSGNASGGAGGTSDFKACMVSDSGGFNDKSFNESGFNGLKSAESELGIAIATQESKSESEFTPNINNLVQQNCNVIITVGFLLATATGDAAKANPDVNFGIVDSTAQDADGKELTLDNVRPLSFDTAQASYLAGYLAAGMTKTGTVATYGGIQIPAVTIFMDGFIDGVAKYNEVHGTAVKTLGWDKAKQNGSFVGDFESVDKGKQLTQTFFDQGADIVMPVAGPVGAGTLSAAQAAPGTMVIWVDADGVETNPAASAVILTSVVKEIGAAVNDTITAANNDKFSNEPYVGTLENKGVDLAPFHDFDAQVPQTLKDEIDGLKADIISGKITVESPSSPK